jgi:two-component system CheB/CheR fusion protein
MRILPYRRLDNMIDGLVITFVDLTQHEEAQSQRARLAAIVESSHDAIVGRTMDGVITTWNQAATRMFGYAESEAIGKRVSLFIPTEDAAPSRTRTRVSNGARPWAPSRPRP